MMSRHRLRLTCGGLDIICVSCYGVVKGEQSSLIALEMPMGDFMKKVAEIFIGRWENQIELLAEL